MRDRRILYTAASCCSLARHADVRRPHAKAGTEPLSHAGQRELVEAAGVEPAPPGLVNFLMARGFSLYSASPRRRPARPMEWAPSEI